MITIVELDRINPAQIEAVRDFMVRHEAVHCIQLAGLERIASGEDFSTRMWLAWRDDQVVGAIGWTEGFNVTVSLMDDEAAIPAFVSAFGEYFDALPGAIGPKPFVRQFVDAWCEMRGIIPKVAMNECVYECDEVIMPSGIAGSARFGNENDAGWIMKWMLRFHEDVGDPTLNMEHITRTRLTPPGGMVIWEVDGQPVSLCGYANPTPNGIRVGPVYTPDEYRNQGYAAAVTAIATQHLLDSGNRFVFLFTDFDYPVSNHVYQKIGYRPVAEFTMYSFPG